jgi:hypothetical protein
LLRHQDLIFSWTPFVYQKYTFVNLIMMKSRKPPAAKKSIMPIVPDAFGQLARDVRRSRDEVIETWQERAAIREYLGNLSRAEAEALAIDDTRALLSEAIE